MSLTTPLLKVPEYIIHDGISRALLFLKLDYETNLSNSTPERSILHTLLTDLSFERLNLIQDAIKVFVSNGKNTQRELKVDLAFNMQRNGAPTIHITMPSESNSQDGMGDDEGYLENQVFEGVSRPVYTKRFSATYDIVISSDNSNEVVLIYHVLRALLLSIKAHLHLKGLEKITFGGQDLAPYMEIASKNFFIRAIRMTLEYETSTVPFNLTHYPTSMTFLGSANLN